MTKAMDETFLNCFVNDSRSRCERHNAAGCWISGIMTMKFRCQWICVRHCDCCRQPWNSLGRAAQWDGCSENNRPATCETCIDVGCYMQRNKEARRRNTSNDGRVCDRFGVPSHGALRTAAPIYNEAESAFFSYGTPWAVPQTACRL